MSGKAEMLKAHSQLKEANQHERHIRHTFISILYYYYYLFRHYEAISYNTFHLPFAFRYKFDSKTFFLTQQIILRSNKAFVPRQF